MFNHLQDSLRDASQNAVQRTSDAAHCYAKSMERYIRREPTKALIAAGVCGALVELGLFALQHRKPAPILIAASTGLRDRLSAIWNKPQPAKRRFW